MDELKNRAGEKLGALHDAAKCAAGNGKSNVQYVFQHTVETLNRIRQVFKEWWHHELIAEGRGRVVAWSRDAVQRIREGALPLSPVLLYEELVTLFKDRVWRRSAALFACGVILGGAAGVWAGARLTGAPNAGGPHARALLSNDQTVMLVEDAQLPGASAGEVLVRVQAFSVCPVDRAVLRGYGAALRALITRSQLTVGRAFAGVVLDVGAGVAQLELGDEVWGCLSEWSGGAAADLLTVRSTRVSKRPRGLSADAAASLPWAGSGALHALWSVSYTPDSCKGKRVVVCGAGSGEGCVLVQLLAAWGAHVTVLAPKRAALVLQDLGALDLIDMDGSNDHVTSSWHVLEQHAAKKGPWDVVLACAGAGTPPGPPDNPRALLKSAASRRAVVELRPRALLSDRLAPPFAFLFGASFYALRALRWVVGCGSHTDWLEHQYRLSGGLASLASLVDSGNLRPVLDKVYLPHEYEPALAHACSSDAVGTTVIRFP